MHVQDDHITTFFVSSIYGYLLDRVSRLLICLELLLARYNELMQHQCRCLLHRISIYVHRVPHLILIDLHLYASQLIIWPTSRYFQPRFDSGFTTSLITFPSPRRTTCPKYWKQCIAWSSNQSPPHEIHELLTYGNFTFMIVLNIKRIFTWSSDCFN